MKTVVEEAKAVRYELLCLVVKVKHVTLICGDNKGVIQNCTIQNKHIVIAYFPRPQNSLPHK